ncbi:MAG TPA: ribonuclease HII [Rhodospirillaceae bacterium]|nr:ribonuclease HII [Rhodospirillaceae bacterium]
MRHEDSSYRIAGVDEAGRGPWAGPVVAAAVILTPKSTAALRAAGVRDSKTLSKIKRQQCFDVIREQQEHGMLWIAIAQAEPMEIDAHNILGATLRTMTRAVRGLPITPDHALIDGNRMPYLPCPGETVVGGDSKILAIAAASIAAKVTRDRLMTELADMHPGYGWERNAGYGTPEHRQGLESLGVTVHHRRSFAPIREILQRTPTYR